MIVLAIISVIFIINGLLALFLIRRKSDDLAPKERKIGYFCSASLLSLGVVLGCDFFH